jgi:hypothetical protein
MGVTQRQLQGFATQACIAASSSSDIPYGIASICANLPGAFRVQPAERGKDLAWALGCSSYSCVPIVLFPLG